MSTLPSYIRKKITLFLLYVFILDKIFGQFLSVMWEHIFLDGINNLNVCILSLPFFCSTFCTLYGDSFLLDLS